MTQVIALCKGTGCFRLAHQRRPPLLGRCPQRGPKRQLDPDVSTCDASAGGAKRALISSLSQPAGAVRYSTEPASSPAEWVQRELAPTYSGTGWTREAAIAGAPPALLFSFISGSSIILFLWGPIPHPYLRAGRGGALTSDVQGANPRHTPLEPAGVAKPERRRRDVVRNIQV